MNKTRKKTAGLFLLLAAAVVCIAVCFSGATDNLAREQQEQARVQLEQAVRKAAVACYAAEGFYPPDLEHLQRHYGVQIDSHRFTVNYQAFGTNLMPDITVLEQTP